ncbi:hypothetical protein FBU30_010959 [Linnemannia zychae]|nr:hypothetical protein FBU30_010959 [Linnemannia zychae]
MSSDRLDLPLLASRPSPLEIPELLHPYPSCDACLPPLVPTPSNRVSREVYFDETMGVEALSKALLGLPWATRLCWSSGQIGRQDRLSQKRHRKEMATLIKNKHDIFKDYIYSRYQPVVNETELTKRHLLNENGFYTYGTGGLDGLLLGTMAPLREIMIIGSVEINNRIIPLFPYFSSLKRLELRLRPCTIESYVTDPYSYMDFGQLLEACPVLEALQIQFRCALGNLARPCFKKDSTKVKPLLLKSINLHSVQCCQSMLESLLTWTPCLRELMLCDIVLKNDWSTTRGSTIDSVKLLDNIKSLSLPLEKLHVSIHDEYFTSTFQSRLWEICPLKDEYSSRELSLDIMDIIRNQPNVITTLELTHSGSGSTLHQYLCSSPHLLHLRAPKASYNLGDMDVHRLFYNNLEEPRIWACSKLITLHLGVTGITLEHSSMPVNVVEIMSQILFGYISIVTPQLQDLYLHGGLGKNSHFPLESGLCYLSRLGRLRNLRIEGFRAAAMFRPEDIEWTLPSGHTSEMYTRRQAVVESWEKQIADESALRIVRQQNVLQQLQQQGEQQKEKSNQTLQPRHVEMMERLQYLGQLVGVKNMIEEMDSKGKIPCWPELRRMTIFSSSEFGQSIERECEWVFR